MCLTRALRKLICRVLVCVFLFGQLAVSAHACPGVSQMTAPTAMARADGPSAMHGGGHCDQMDQDSANLCAEHCKFGQQRSDTGTPPTVAAPVLALLYEVVPKADPLEAAPELWDQAVLTAAVSPPHAILHCVLRI